MKVVLPRRVHYINLTPLNVGTQMNDIVIGLFVNRYAFGRAV
jgi:hypothetical protein